jgi:hypothetical protein
MRRRELRSGEKPYSSNDIWPLRHARAFAALGRFLGHGVRWVTQQERPARVRHGCHSVMAGDAGGPQEDVWVLGVVIVGG